MSIEALKKQSNLSSLIDEYNKQTTPETRSFDDEEAINPFDLWKGANFKLKIRKVDGFWNYDKSEFDAVAPLLDTDAALEKVYDAEYPLKPFHEESNFKSYTDLKDKMERVLGQEVDNRTAEQVASDMTLSKIFLPNL